MRRCRQLQTLEPFAQQREPLPRVTQRAGGADAESGVVHALVPEPPVEPLHPALAAEQEPAELGQQPPGREQQGIGLPDRRRQLDPTPVAGRGLEARARVRGLAEQTLQPVQPPGLQTLPETRARQTQQVGHPAQPHTGQVVELPGRQPERRQR